MECITTVIFLAREVIADFFPRRFATLFAHVLSRHGFLYVNIKVLAELYRLLRSSAEPFPLILPDLLLELLEPD